MALALRLPELLPVMPALNLNLNAHRAVIRTWHRRFGGIYILCLLALPFQCRDRWGEIMEYPEGRCPSPHICIALGGPLFGMLLRVLWTRL
jgi:hypothetical protein